MEHYNDGEVNIGPLIDLNTEDFCPTVKDTTMAKSPFPVGSSTPHSTGHNSDGTVDQVLKAITALSVRIEKQNSALEDRFGKLSKCLDALESKQRNRHVTLATDHRESDVLDLFGDPEEECFSALPAPISPSPYRQLPQQREKPRVQAHTMVQPQGRIIKPNSSLLPILINGIGKPKQPTWRSA